MDKHVRLAVGAPNGSRLNPVPARRQAIIGVDIGGTKTLAVLFDAGFKVLGESRFQTEPKSGEKVFNRRLAHALGGLAKKARQRNKVIIGTGVGCAGNVNDGTMELQVSPNIPFLKGFQLRKKIAKMTGTKVFLGNDVHMGLYGEFKLGAARGALHAIGIFIGTGIGGAILINGRLYAGATGIAGDIGHQLIQPLGPLGGSERQGVLDNVASSTAIAAEAAVFASRQWAPHLWKIAGADLAKIHSKTLAQAIRRGDDKIEDLVRSRARIIGIALSNLVDFINPDTIVLGGGLVEDMPKLVLSGVRAGIEAHSTRAAFKKLRVAAAELKRHSVAAGAAKMAWECFAECGGTDSVKLKKKT